MVGLPNVVYTLEGCVTSRTARYEADRTESGMLIL